MDPIKVSLDRESCWSKPTSEHAAVISKRIGKSVKELNSMQDIRSFVSAVGKNMHTFCPVTFKEGIRDKKHFEQQQFFALDFDNTDPKSKITFEQAKSRAEHYDLPVCFAYDTFSSVNHNKFRMVFMNDNPVTDIRVSELILRGLTTIFPEADPCCKNPVQMYYGGENVIYSGVNQKACPTINAESVVRNTINYLENKYTPKHYKPYVTKFYREAGVRLDAKNNPDISIVDNPIECTAERVGASHNGDFLHNPFIVTTPIGRKSRRYYKINFGSDCTSDLSQKKKTNYHKPYDLSALKDIKNVCQLFREFDTGRRRLSHMELFGIATNMIQMQKGDSKFKEILRVQSYYDNEQQKYVKWEQDLRRIKGYKPYSCSEFCPYIDICHHGKNILSTAKVKYHHIEQIENHEKTLVDLDAACHDFEKWFCQAIESGGNGWHVIKSQTALGKTETVLNFLRSTGLKVLLAVPTNILKREVAQRAKAKGIKLAVSPSLHELKDDLPGYIWNEIETLLNAGISPLQYILHAIETNDPDCADIFKKYKKDLDAFENYEGHAITTHRRLSRMDVSKYDLIIVDEDIIYSTVIPSRITIPISDLEELEEESLAGKQLRSRIKKILKKAEKSEFFKMEPLDYEDQNKGLSMKINVPALCGARYFCYRDASIEDGLKKDSITFAEDVQFSEEAKYIMLSATADENICEYYFGEDNVTFYECLEAKLTGALVQYYDNSMSRSYIKEHPDVFTRIKRGTGCPHTISFKRFERIYGGDLHYGNCAGCDVLKGQDIDVIGTPHQPEWIYKLFAYSLGFDVDYELMPGRMVDNNGYRFRFTTYENEELRNIQFYMINSEIEQAVGRARLLRCDCTVNLFSNFPLRQAILKEFGSDEEPQDDVTV